MNSDFYFLRRWMFAFVYLGKKPIFTSKLLLAVILTFAESEGKYFLFFLIDADVNSTFLPK